MSDRRSRGRIVLAAASLIVLGAAAGVTADRLLHRPAHGFNVEVRRLHDSAIDALVAELDLRPDQNARVRAILQARQPDVDQVWHDAHTRLLTILGNTVVELEAVLDTAQIERLHALVEHLHGGPLPRGEVRDSSDTTRDSR